MNSSRKLETQDLEGSVKRRRQNEGKQKIPRAQILVSNATLQKKKLRLPGEVADSQGGKIHKTGRYLQFLLRPYPIIFIIIIIIFYFVKR